jgi:hypothetical protein
VRRAAAAAASAARSRPYCLKREGLRSRSEATASALDGVEASGEASTAIDVASTQFLGERHFPAARHSMEALNVGTAMRSASWVEPVVGCPSNDQSLKREPEPWRASRRGIAQGLWVSGARLIAFARTVRCEILPPEEALAATSKAAGAERAPRLPGSRD